ncbi:MAG TPA: ABC transporter substrate-binding protein [Candidatus Acidoferrales bacterium]|nr:ABC transporter substrate-binding protein [Candidatus Acidoferrales bacterium]
MMRVAAVAIGLFLLTGNVCGFAQGTTIRVATTPNDSGAEAFYAADIGFFKKAGLDVEVIAISNASLIHAGVVSGSIAWIDKNGGDAKTIKFVELPDSAAAPAVAGGRVDAASVAEPFLDEALKLETRVLAPTYSAIANEFMIGAWFSTLDYAKAHPDVIRKFGTVMLETARWANKNQGRSARILEKYAKVRVSPTMARVGYAERLTPSQIQPLIDAAARYGTIKNSFPAADLLAPGLQL